MVENGGFSSGWDHGGKKVRVLSMFYLKQTSEVRRTKVAAIFRRKKRGKPWYWKGFRRIYHAVLKSGTFDRGPKAHRVEGEKAGDSAWDYLKEGGGMTVDGWKRKGLGSERTSGSP